MSTSIAYRESVELAGSVAGSEHTSLRQHPALWLTLAAIVLRLIVFTSRGDYIAFDEGWYLLLGRSVFDGSGYTLSGLRHTTLSPLFPLLAGAVGTLTGDVVWGGRIIAAITAGLLVWPCWHIARRIGGKRAANIAGVFIVVMPSLTPFAAPYWIDWDLWVGAEPVLHLFLFGAFALLLRAREQDATLDWLLAGACFSLAYLARPEAIIPFGFAGLAVGIEALVRRSPQRIVGALALACAFAATAAPYWLYLHDTLGRLAISGRVVDAPVRVSVDSAAPRTGAASGIERMLWADDDRQYVRALYGLDASGTQLRSTYWGVPDRVEGTRPADPVTATVGEPLSADTALSIAQHTTVPVPDPGADNPLAASSTGDPPSRWLLYLRALGTIVPWFLWPLVLVGIPRRSIGTSELIVALPLIITSVAIARLVGADPRTQLFIVPLTAMYAALGIVRVSDVVDDRVTSAGLRRGFIGGALALVVAAGLCATVARWFFLGVTMGSPHHLVGAANRAAGDAVQEVVPVGEPIMSWHPAIALYGSREWRVLPYADLGGIVRYANAIDCEYVVLSSYYPGSQLIEDIDADHLLLHVPPGATADAGAWRIDLQHGSESQMIGRLRYDLPSDSVAVLDRDVMVP